MNLDGKKTTGNGLHKEQWLVIYLSVVHQVTGVYFADPGYKDVPDLAEVGFPIAEINSDSFHNNYQS